MFDWSVSQLVSAEPSASGLLARFGGVYVLDSSTVMLPNELAQVWAGCGGSGAANQAGLKIHVAFELQRGGLHGLSLTSARERAVSVLQNFRQQNK